jgi:threonylcarbamoyladenosine tRNA methylthiotransferase MtaB
MPHLHLPLQSGSDTVLARMARRCSTAELGALVAAARGAIPDLTLTTDLIVGFPGETDAEWADTVATVERIGFGHIHIFTYSPRPGTTAARMPGHLPHAIKKARSRELHAIAARMKREHLERFVGHTRPVLWDGDAGYTDNYLRVAAASGSVDNVIAPATLDRIDDSSAGYVAALPDGVARQRPPRLALRVVG